jgi:hypothetical protein
MMVHEAVPCHTGDWCHHDRSQDLLSAPLYTPPLSLQRFLCVSYRHCIMSVG